VRARTFQLAKARALAKEPESADSAAASNRTLLEVSRAKAASDVEAFEAFFG